MLTRKSSLLMNVMYIETSSSSHNLSIFQGVSMFSVTTLAGLRPANFSFNKVTLVSKIRMAFLNLEKSQEN